MVENRFGTVILYNGSLDSLNKRNSLEQYEEVGAVDTWSFQCRDDGSKANVRDRLKEFGYNGLVNMRSVPLGFGLFNKQIYVEGTPVKRVR